MAVHTDVAAHLYAPHAPAPDGRGVGCEPSPSFIEAQESDHLSATATIDPSVEEQLGINYSNAAIPDQQSSSALFWPDTESFLHSIMSLDSMSSEQLMTTMSAAPDLNFDLARVDYSNSSNCDGRVENGYKAIHTLNGLISNTVRNHYRYY